MSGDLDAWLKAGKHLPPPMRDFHDQKDVFGAMHTLQGTGDPGGAQNRVEQLFEVTPVAGHAYVVDRFLTFLARRGWTLQRSRADLPFGDLDADVKRVAAARRAQFQALVLGIPRPVGGNPESEGGRLTPTAGGEEPLDEPVSENPWRDLVWKLAVELNCLPSSAASGNDHLVAAARRLSAQARSPGAPLTDEQILECENFASRSARTTRDLTLRTVRLASAIEANPMTVAAAARALGKPYFDRKPGYAGEPVPTTWMERFREALAVMCGGKMPPLDMCEQWVRNEQIDGADPLQAWVVDHAQVAWHTGIGTIEAAQVWADTPEEGVDHEDREDAYPRDPPSEGEQPV